jgi:hypothetical protein
MPIDTIIRTAEMPIAPVPRLGLSIDEAAASLGLSPRAFADLIKLPDGPPVFRAGRRIVIPTASFAKWLSDQVEKAKDAA